VAIYIGVRGIESPVYIDNGNRDIPIRDFPTGLRAVVEDRCRKVNPHWSQRQVASGIGESRSRRGKFYAFQFREFRTSDRGKDHGLVDQQVTCEKS
jgi:hypothetical protein